MRIKRKPNAVSLVAPDERAYLRKSGMVEVAERRTRGLLQSHMVANSGLRTLARDCYLQGIRDAAESTDHDGLSTDE